MTVEDAGRRRGPGWRIHALQWGLVGVVVLLDQLAKAAVLRSLELHESVPVIEGFFDITHVLNRGGVWGLGSQASPAVKVVVFLALPTLITGLAAWFSAQLRPEERLRRLGLSLVVGGAIGNLIDRLRLGMVVDFLSFHVGEHYWPAFNLADSAICVGVGILLVATALVREDEPMPPPNASAP